MFLEKLEISGFKSFAHKIKLVFPRSPKSRGITAIVGPNGSGKSNVVEAIRWTLGEQSMKMLRSKKSEDVIFSGSEKKARLGLAEVSLFLDNQDKSAPIDYSQISITRRIYRNGQGEYLINQRRARLQDILILLAKASFGLKSYSILGQGMVDKILLSSQAERIAFFNEATGIQEYRIKRDLAISKIKKTEENLSQTEIAIREIEPRLRSLTRQVKKLEKRVLIEKKLNNLRSYYYGNLWQKINQEINHVNKELITANQKRERAEKEVTDLRKRLKELTESEKEETAVLSLEKKQREINTLKNKLVSQIAFVEGKIRVEKEISPVEKGWQFNLDDLSELQKGLNKIKNKHQQLLKEIEKTPIKQIKENLEKINDLLDNLVNFIEAKIGRKGRLIGDPPRRREKLEKERQEIKEKITEIDKQLEEIEKQIEKTRTEERRKRKSFFDLQETYQEKQNSLNQILNENNQIEIAKARLETKKETLLEEIKKEIGNLPDFNNQDSSSVAQGAKEEESAGWWTEICKLKSQLELIGGIDPEVEKEYQECRQRYDFLSGQINDLKSASRNLTKVIKDLNKIIEEQFNKTLNKINQQFDKYFKILFGGGKAQLILQKIAAAETQKETETLNDETSASQEIPESSAIREETLSKIEDIEIRATPPGKKVKNIEMLSGGERALASLALIYSIIDTNAPPFVVLDEVDAALDEENSARFANILEKLAQKTQFIIVTHNRQTMEKADILYGVSMGEDGISKLYSLKL